MALWLELIPRLHKSDNLDARYHQLDDHANLSTFEDQPYTRVTNHAALLWRNESPPPSSASAAADDAAPVPVTYQPFPPRSPRLPTLARRPQNRSASVLPQPKVVLQASTRKSEASSDYSNPAGGSNNNTLSLGVTVGVGCALFSLNLLIFAVLYYQRDRMRREMRLHCPGGELSLLEQKDQELIARHKQQATTTTTYRLQRCGSPPTAADVDSNGDLLLLPPSISSSNRNSLVVAASSLQDDTASIRAQKRKRTSTSIPVALPETPPRHSSSSSAAAVTSSPAVAAVTSNHVECRTTAKYVHVPLNDHFVSEENASDSVVVVVDSSTSV